MAWRKATRDGLLAWHFTMDKCVFVEGRDGWSWAGLGCVRSSFSWNHNDYEPNESQQSKCVQTSISVPHHLV